MRTCFITYICLMICLGAYSQAVPQILRGNFIYMYEVYCYEFSHLDGDNFGFEISKLDTAYTWLTGRPDTSNVADSAKVYFSEFNKEVFIRIFKSQMMYRFNVADHKKLDDKASEVFYKVLTRFNLLEDEPVTANLILRRTEVKSYLKANGQMHEGRLNKLVLRHYVHSVEIETEDGVIKNIKARLVKPGQSGKSLSFLEFKNQNPISISGKFDPETFADFNLYCLNCGGVRELSRFMQLSDLLILDIILESEKEDYSPANTKITLSPSNSVEELKKEPKSRIVEVSAFSDFVGLDQEEPNGLVQIEAKRKMNLNPKYYLLFPQRKSDKNMKALTDLSDTDSYTIARTGKWFRYTIPVYKNDGDAVRNVPGEKDSLDRTSPALHDKTVWIKARKFHSTYFNYIGHWEPRLLFAKLEENNRLIMPESISDNRISPVTMYRYQLLSLGFTANLLKFSFPQWKLSWTMFDGGAYWFRTRVGVTPDISIPLNNSYLVMGSCFHFKPDSRWGVNFGGNFISERVWNNTYSLSGNHIWQLAIDGSLKTSATARMFFRYRLIWKAGDTADNFTQIQLGYSLNLFALTGEKK